MSQHEARGWMTGRAIRKLMIKHDDVNMITSRVSCFPQTSPNKSFQLAKLSHGVYNPMTKKCYLIPYGPVG